MPKEEVNGFIICEARSEGMTYGVYHPVYDGFFCLLETNDKQEAIDWANKEDAQEWGNKLL